MKLPPTLLITYQMEAQRLIYQMPRCCMIVTSTNTQFPPRVKYMRWRTSESRSTVKCYTISFSVNNMTVCKSMHTIPGKPSRFEISSFVFVFVQIFFSFAIKIFPENLSFYSRQKIKEAFLPVIMSSPYPFQVLLIWCADVSVWLPRN